MCSIMSLIFRKIGKLKFQKLFWTKKLSILLSNFICDNAYLTSVSVAITETEFSATISADSNHYSKFYASIFSVKASKKVSVKNGKLLVSFFQFRLQSFGFGYQSPSLAFSFCLRIYHCLNCCCCFPSHWQNRWISTWFHLQLRRRKKISC